MTPNANGKWKNSAELCCAIASEGKTTEHFSDEI